MSLSLCCTSNLFKMCSTPCGVAIQIKLLYTSTDFKGIRMTDQIILGFAMISDVEHQLNPGQIFEFIPLSLGSAGLLCVRR